MKADILVLERRSKHVIQEAFGKAIAVAGRSGFIQDAALGNELAGEFFFSTEDDYWARHYFTRSVALYNEWGAKAKVEQLQKSKGGLIDTSCLGTLKSSTTASMRHFISGESSQIHENIDLNSTVFSISKRPRDSGSGESVNFDPASINSSLCSPFLPNVKSSIARPILFPTEEEIENA